MFHKQEAEIRKNQRVEAIRKANDLLYEQTDKMKLLRSQALYCDVLHTRVGQIEEKKKAKDAIKEDNQRYHEVILRKVADGEEAERRKLEAQQKVIEEVKVVRTQQREEARHIREEIARKNREEGERMKAEAKARAEEELREYEAKIRMAAESNARMVKANEDLKAVRLQMKEQEKLAEQERDKEVEKIEYRKKMLKHLEQVRFEKAQVSRQKIIDAAVEQLAKKTSTEQAILEKQVKDLQEREDRLLAEKARIMEKQRREIREQREQQMARKEEEMRREHEEEMANIMRKRQENEEAIRLENEKALKRRQDTIKFKNTQLEEARERARRREEEKLIETEQARFLASTDNQEDTRFLELCKAEIAKNVQQGKPIYPLLRAMEYSQPALIPAKRVPATKKPSSGWNNSWAGVAWLDLVWQSFLS